MNSTTSFSSTCSLLVTDLNALLVVGRDQQPLIDLGVLLREAAEDHALRQLRLLEKRPHVPDRDARRPLLREAVDAGADAGERERPRSDRRRDLERALVTAGELVVFEAVAERLASVGVRIAAPHRADRMDDLFDAA